MSENPFKYAVPGIGMIIGGWLAVVLGFAFENPDIEDRGVVAMVVGTVVTLIGLGVYYDEKRKK